MIHSIKKYDYSQDFDGFSFSLTHKCAFISLVKKNNAFHNEIKVSLVEIPSQFHLLSLPSKVWPVSPANEGEGPASS